MSFLDNVLSGLAYRLKTLSGVLDATHAEWLDPTGGGGGGGTADQANALTCTGGDPIDVSGAAPPTAGQVLTALDDLNAAWVDPLLPPDIFDTANTVLCALDGDGGLGPVPVFMPPSTVLLRAAAGDIFAGTPADLATLLGSAVVSSALFDANTVLVADVDNTPHALAAPASSVMTRLATGAIKWGSVAELQALLAISVSGGGAITAFAFASNAATLSLLTSKNWAASNTLTGNSTITITNGAEGDYGTIYVRQDGTGGRTLTFTVAGRTILRDANAIDDNPQSFNSTITAYNYQFVTMVGGVYVRITKVFLA
jgi:hypothetical protein